MKKLVGLWCHWLAGWSGVDMVELNVSAVCDVLMTLVSSPDATWTTSTPLILLVYYRPTRHSKTDNENARQNK